MSKLLSNVSGNAVDHLPKDPCMIYLPTLTIKINQMQVNIPYMDPMGLRCLKY